MQLTTIQHLRDADPKEVSQALESFVHVAQRIEAHLEDMNLQEHCKRLGVFSASDIGNKTGKSLCGSYPVGCGRLLYYRYIGAEPRDRIPPRTRRIFDTGTKIHEQLQGYLQNIAAGSNGTEIFVKEAAFNENNSHVANTYDIESTTDGVWTISVPDLSLRFGLEIKSMKDELFKKLNGPDASHVVQCHVYMACLDLPAMVVLYYNKNDSSLIEYTVLFQQKVWRAITSKIDYVREHAIDEKEPLQEVGYHCRTCRYAYLCKPPKPEKVSRRVNLKRFSLPGG